MAAFEITKYPSYETAQTLNDVSDGGGTYGKRNMLRDLAAEMEPNCPNWQYILFRIANTDLTALTDGAEVTFDSFELDVA